MITLLTDFGDADVYVGVMKGVIAQINPAAVVVDLTHQIPPQNIAQGSFHLANAYAHFPPGTVHLAVVDPGVGGQRRAIALQTASASFVGPDNGLFSGVLAQETQQLADAPRRDAPRRDAPRSPRPVCPALTVVELNHPQFWYTSQPSSTFHGRDIFAAVAAYIALGYPLHNLGQSMAPESLVQLSQPRYQLTDDGALGMIQIIDHFGNLITNIPAACVGNRPWQVSMGGHSIASATCYRTPTADGLLALRGSHGWLEIALEDGSAQQRLQVTVGSPVQLLFLDINGG